MHYIDIDYIRGVGEKMDKKASDAKISKYIPEWTGKESEVTRFCYDHAVDFTERFDPNSYLAVVRAFQEFDIPKKYGKGDLDAAVVKIQVPVQNWSMRGDVCFFPEEQERIHIALTDQDKPSEYRFIEDATRGHDTFLTKSSSFKDAMRQFLSQHAYRE
jgi:homoserine acetyltransferase